MLTANRVRPAAVAGSFYPATRDALEHDVRDYLDRAAVDHMGAAAKALVVPHAGYVYSAPVAAVAYASLAANPIASGAIRRVVLLGPAHTVALRAMAVPGASGFATPAGVVPVDADLRARALRHASVVVDDGAHAAEHCLEVQLPFLQAILDDWTVLPVVVGRVPAEVVAELIDALWGGPETLVVVSTDLSHYETYDAAQRHDRATVRAILDADVGAIAPSDACGSGALRGLLLAARRRGLAVNALATANSADAGGPRDRVVGYGAFALVERGLAGATVEDQHDLDAGHGESLLDAAEDALRSVLRAPGGAPGPRRARPGVRRPGAAFVTLERDGELLGCIGSLEARRSLIDDVAAHALDAAFADPRFAPLDRSQLPGLEITVSVLGEPRPIAVDDYEALLAELRPGVDGLVVETPGHRATLLPTVWEQLGEPEEFLAALWRKAELEPRAWPTGITVSRYTTQQFHRELARA